MSAKNYLITGAARGIGRGLSRLLLEKGNKVVLIDNNVDELNHLTQKLSQSHHRGSDFETIECNLREPADIKAATSKASALFAGRLDVLINNAANTNGVGSFPLSELSLEDWNASIETNLTAPMLMSQGCLSMLRKQQSRAQGGVVINMSSTRAFMSEPNNEPYSASKGGLIGLTQSMAVSLAPMGIRVSTILPGWINVTNECKEADDEGRSWEHGLSKEDNEWHLTGRVGRVEDVLKAVEYLAENDGISGAELVVDGGVTRKMVYPE